MLLNELLSVNRRLLVVLILDSRLLVDVLFLVRLVDRHVIRVRVRVLETRIHRMVVILVRPDIVLIVEVVIELGTRNVLDLCVGLVMLFLLRVAIMSPIWVEFLSLVNRWVLRFNLVLDSMVFLHNCRLLVVNYYWNRLLVVDYGLMVLWWHKLR